MSDIKSDLGERRTESLQSIKTYMNRNNLKITGKGVMRVFNWYRTQIERMADWTLDQLSGHATPQQISQIANDPRFDELASSAYPAGSARTILARSMTPWAIGCPRG